MSKPIDCARFLRRDLTDAERALWQRLRSRRFESVKFRRQHPIPPFIVDFCCTEQRLIIEIDGGQHAVATEADRSRTESLNRQGYRVIRFWNNDVLQEMDGVLEVIARALKTPSP
jgi:very-short-patch-repair endonuclease